MDDTSDLNSVMSEQPNIKGLNLNEKKKKRDLFEEVYNEEEDYLLTHLANVIAKNKRKDC
jgi:F0F1-type ATP synthase delta subunit